LHALGIPVLVDRPGVGANLQEHPGISVSALLAPAARLRGTTRRHIHLGLRYSSGVAGGSVSDMYLMAAAKSAWHPLGERIGTLIAWVNTPHARGNVMLQSADPRAEPVAAFNHLADPRDAERLKAAVRLMGRLIACPPLAALLLASGPSSYTGFAKALGRQTLRNHLLTTPVAHALDWLPPLREPFFRRFVAGGTTLRALLADDDALDSYVRTSVFGQWHPAGTCRMGDPARAETVVDPAGRVVGVEGLRVADASIMPIIPRANLNLPTIMIAEKLALTFGGGGNAGLVSGNS
jgi:5-(hydroxymethyl)furfural/furfural oxidase